MMKTTSARLLLCYVTLFSNVIDDTFPSFCAAATVEKPSPVVDIAGNNVRAGVDYYILPVMRGMGGGLTLAPAGNRSCPLNVAQDRLEVKNGLRLTFSPVDTNEVVVRVSTDHNVKFSASSICVQSTVWVLERDEASGRYLITTGGVEGSPGAQTTSNWFKIEEYEGDYKLVFCPTVCNFCKVVCKDVSVFVEKDGARLLGFTLTDGAPFKVMFKKA